ncbi:MAG: hypothetical protein JWO08_1776 [Verrucomicrobiaceae bacterium]|nr:hypothetical protein [Verrucomicrobiaceae bacterium]
MKPRFFSPYPVVLGLMMCLGADYSSAGDFRIPNPIPKIVRSVKRAGNAVGNAVVRVAERVEEGTSDTRRDPNRRPRDELVDPTLVPGEPILSPDGRPLPNQSTTTTVEIRREPIADPALVDGRYSNENPKLKVDSAHPEAVPSNSVPHSATQRPSGPSARPTSSTTATAEAKGIDSTTLPDQGAPITPPAPLPEIKFGKRVPDHPGLVYPPGVEEVPANMLDVQGMAPGTTVRNPVTGTVFRVP